MTTTVRQKTCRWLSGLLENFISVLEWEHKAWPNFGSMCHHISFSSFVEATFFLLLYCLHKIKLMVFDVNIKSLWENGGNWAPVPKCMANFLKICNQHSSRFCICFFWIKKMKFKKFEIIYICLWSHQSSSE